jgi:two-component system sensor histidine kinase BarA
MSSSGIKRSLMLIILVPAIISVMLIGLVVNWYIDSLDEEFIEYGELITAQLVASSEYGVVTGNLDALESSVSNTFYRKNITAITIVDSQGTVLISKGAPNSIPELKQSNNLLCELSETVQVFCSLIQSRPIQIDDFEEIDSSDVRTVGAIYVEISREDLKTKKSVVLVITGVLLLIGVTIIYMVVHYVDRNISQPIVYLTSAVERIKKGDLSTRVRTDAKWELNVLQNGINNMASAISRLNRD